MPSRRLRSNTSKQVSSWLNFNPLMFTPSLWLDASDSSTITHSGGAVSQWRDKSGNGLHVSQVTEAAKPTTNSATQNGLNVLVFDGGDVLSNALNTNVNAGTVTAYAVFKENVRVNNAGVISLHEATGDDNNSFKSVLIETGNGNNFASSVRRNALGRVGSTPLAPWGVYVGLYRETGVVQLHLNDIIGTEGIATGTFGVADAGVVVGGRFFTSQILATNRLNGQYGEVIIYPRVHSTGERKTVQDYLKAKWGTP